MTKKALAKPPVPDDLEELARALKLVPIVRAWANAVEVKALALMMAGKKLPDQKLVAGKTQRKWSNEKKARRALLKMGLQEDEFAPRVLMSPAGVEKLLGRKKAVALAPLVTRTTGRPTIAPESDPRPAIEVDPFFDIDLEDEPAGE